MKGAYLLNYIIMEARELRLGNFIKWKVLNEEKQLDTSEFRFAIAMKFISTSINKYIEGIPLTEEWLVKFGFELDNLLDEDKTMVYTKTYNQHDSITLYKDFGIMDLDLAYNLEYVHQLQNLYFALTAEELTIK